MKNKEISEVDRVIAMIHSLLAGHPPKIQGTILADCVAIWLARHVIENDKEATIALRAGMLTVHIDAVKQLTIVNAKMLGTEPD